MSGGSHNYLYSAEACDLFKRQSDLEKMAESLESLGYRDAAKETLHVKYLVEHMIVRLECRIERLGNLWRAVEWHDSGDSSLEAVHKAIDKYRGDSKPVT